MRPTSTREAWEYTDSYAYRLGTDSSANPVFDAAEWFIAGPDALETGDDIEERQLILDSTDPGTHDCTPPVPTEEKSWSEVKNLYR